MNIDELVQLVTDTEITTESQFYDHFINVEQLVNNNVDNINEAQKIITDIFIGNNTIFSAKNNKKIKKIINIIPSIVKSNVVISVVLNNALAGKYDDDINGISIFLSIIDNLLIINPNLDLNEIYDKLINTKLNLAQALKTKMKK